jgi:hypothetical protein
MRTSSLAVLACFCLSGFTACTSTHSSANLNYYHGKNVPAEFFRVLRHTAAEIEFEIRVKFLQPKLYHLVLDGNTPLAEDWFPTMKANQSSYTVILKAKPGVQFVAGKAYRLCIGDQSPELISVHSTKYVCTADYEFKLE